MFCYFLFYLGFGGGVILFYYGCYCGYFYIVGYEVIRKKVREEWIIKVKFWMFYWCVLIIVYIESWLKRKVRESFVFKC